MKLNIFGILLFIIISWLTSIIVTLAGDFAILSTAVFLSMNTLLFLILIYFKDGSDN